MKMKRALGRNEIDVLEEINEDLCYEFGEWLESQYIVFHLPNMVTPEMLSSMGYTVKAQDELIPMFQAWMESR